MVVPAPTSCTCCGSQRLSKVGEDVTETLEVIPRQWKVIQTVREKFTCRNCEKLSQPPAPFHAVPRGWAGPNLLATIVFEKYGQHQPLNRQSERYAREGVELSISTLADQVGACAVALRPLHELIAAHVLDRRSWLFCGSDRGGMRAAAMYTLIVTAKLNDVDPQAWLADVLARIAELPHTRVHELLPWNWKAARHQTLAA